MIFCEKGGGGLVSNTECMPRKMDDSTVEGEVDSTTRSASESLSCWIWEEDLHEKYILSMDGSIRRLK